jgi:hypothetical protein
MIVSGGGGEMVLWKITHGLQELAHERKERCFEIFLQYFTKPMKTDDPTDHLEVKCGILSFFNTFLISCSADQSMKLLLRQELIRSEFQKLLLLPHQYQHGHLNNSRTHLANQSLVSEEEEVMIEDSNPQEQSIWLHEWIPSSSSSSNLRENPLQATEDLIQNFASKISFQINKSLSTLDPSSMILGSYPLPSPSSSTTSCLMKTFLKISQGRYLEYIRHEKQLSFDLQNLISIDDCHPFPISNTDESALPSSLHSLTLEFKEEKENKILETLDPI